MKHQYVIIRGAIRTAKALLQQGSTIELSEQEAKQLDPQGTALMEKAQYDAREKAKAAAGEAFSEGLPDDEQELLESYREAKRQKVAVTLVALSQLETISAKADALESQLRKAQDVIADLEAKLKAQPQTSAPEQHKGEQKKGGK